LPSPPQPGDQTAAEPPVEELRRKASDPTLTEDQALALLARRDLPSAVVECLSKNAAAIQHRKVLTAVVAHPCTPRHVCFPALRQLFTFELMQVALSPAVAAEVRRAAEESLIGRLEKISLGERLTLARRASGRVASVLLLDDDGKVIAAALENPFMTEALVASAIASSDAPQHLIDQVGQHARWSKRRDVRLALLRNGSITQAAAEEFARDLPPAMLREVLASSGLPPDRKASLLQASQAKT
jgi:hypothetical protein